MTMSKQHYKMIAAIVSHYEDMVEAYAGNAYGLASALKDQIEDDLLVSPDGSDRLTTGIVGDLLGAALSEVNWAEIAEGRLDN